MPAVSIVKNLFNNHSWTCGFFFVVLKSFCSTKKSLHISQNMSEYKYVKDVCITEPEVSSFLLVPSYSGQPATLLATIHSVPSRVILFSINGNSVARLSDITLYQVLWKLFETISFFFFLHFVPFCLILSHFVS
jgi:hypothetical protein